MTKQKGKAARANECNRKCTALKQAATMRATMKNTRDMLFTQAVNLMHETENDPQVERAPYRSMPLLAMGWWAYNRIKLLTIETKK